MPRRIKLRTQRRIPGMPREPLPACVMGEIKRKVDAEAARHGVSRSFVVAVVLARVFKVAEQEQY